MKYKIKYLTETQIINNYKSELLKDNPSNKKIYISKLESNKLPPIDSIKYFINLKNALFAESNIFDLYIISHKVQLVSKQLYKPCVILFFLSKWK